MATHWTRSLFALCALIFAAAAYAAPHFADLKFSDEKDGDIADSFTPDTPKIFLHAGLVDMPSGTKLTSTWIAEDTHGAAPPNYKIDSVSLDAGGAINVATFSLSKPNAGWPVGTYRVELYINGDSAGTAHFSIAKDD